MITSIKIFCTSNLLNYIYWVMRACSIIFEIIVCKSGISEDVKIFKRSEYSHFIGCFKFVRKNQYWPEQNDIFWVGDKKWISVSTVPNGLFLSGCFKESLLVVVYTFLQSDFLNHPSSLISLWIIYYSIFSRKTSSVFYSQQEKLAPWKFN